jgi:CBS domain-containing protein
MERHRVKRLPVVGGQVIAGIVTRQNLLRALIGRSSAAGSAGGDDKDVRERLLGELKAQPWAPLIDVFVEGGRLKLVGTILDDRQRAAIRVAAENVPGVKSINFSQR